MNRKSCISFNLRWCFAFFKGLNIADVCFSAVGEASIQQRSIPTRPPCFISDSALPVAENLLDYYLGGIKTAIYALKIQTENLLQTMGITYCINLSANEMENAGFMDLSSLDTDADKRTFLQDFCSNTQSFLNQMRSHYGILNEMANYFEELSVTSVNNNPREFQEHIYDTMCRIKIALRSQNQDPLLMVPNGILSELFVMYRRGTVCRQQTSEFISTLDARRIVTYLETVYRPVNTIVCI